MASRSLADAEPRLAELWTEVFLAYTAEHPGRDLAVTCTRREPAEQFELYKIGRRQRPDGSWTRVGPAVPVLTMFDGTVRRSKHNLPLAQALDFAVLVGGKVAAAWEPGERATWAWQEYEAVGVLAEERGLVWGGRWAALRDGPHLELP